MTDFSPAAERTMLDLQRAVSAVLNRANHNKTPLDLAIFAVARVLRELIRMVPSAGRAMILELVVAFLQDEKAATEDKLITLQ